MKILLFANTDWFLYNFRLDLAGSILDRGHQLVLVAPQGVYSEQLKVLGFQFIPFPMDRRGMNPVIELVTLVRLYWLYRREQPDLVHHFTIKCVLYGSLVSRLLRIKCVVNSVEGMGYVFTGEESGRKTLRSIVKWFYKLALKNTRVIFQNPDDRQYFLERHLVDQNQTTLIRSPGVDVHKFFYEPESKDDPLVILPARMLWDKGVSEFVTAARVLLGEGIHARFALVGDSDEGNPTSVPTSQLKAWQEEGVIEWWGWRDDMQAIYRQSHIVCLPSYREGVSKTLIEATASGRPIVTCDVPGCREVVTQGENGVLVPPRNADRLAEALRTLLTSKSSRQRMGAIGRQMAETLFSIELVNARIWEAYQSCTSAKTAEVKP
jgi:glycosyltransferase involved in cell wall biosynthesis